VKADEVVLSYHCLQVVGQGIQNPYRLRPFTGVKVPADVPFQPSIEIYNPHDTPLYVKEVFTSGDFLHLSLPPAEGESRTRLWVHTHISTVLLVIGRAYPLQSFCI